MSFQRVIKHLTIRIVSRFHTTSNKEKDKKKDAKYSAYYSRWFGFIPFAVKTSFKRKRK